MTKGVRLIAIVAALTIVMSVIASTGACAQTNTIYYGDRYSTVNKMNSDGTGNAALITFFDFNPFDSIWYSTQGKIHTSYQLHGGKRWFVVLAYRFTDEVNDIWTTAVVFRSETGTTFIFPIGTDIDNPSAANSSVRWLPGDSEVTLTSHSTSTGATGVFAMPVTFDTGGNPSMGPEYLKMATQSYVGQVDAYTPTMSVVGEDFDWNPAGTAFVFNPVPSWGTNPLAAGLYTWDGVTQRQIWTGTPWGFGWGATNKICFAYNGIRKMNADGTGVTTIVAPYKSGRNMTYNAYPAWSPDGARVVFSFNDYRSYQGFKTVASAGGATTSLNHGGSDAPYCWR